MKKLNELANLIIIRNHLSVVINNPNIVEKKKYRQFSQVVSDLDRKILGECADFQELFSEKDTSEKDTPKEIETTKAKKSGKKKKAKKEIVKAHPGSEDPEIAKKLAEARKDPKVLAAKSKTE